jgi:hypothetical protein
MALVYSCHGRWKSLAPGAEKGGVERAAEWDQVFDRSSGWTGADVAASFVVPGNRALWVFGDTWVGEVEDGRHAGAALVNNSIAVHAFDPARPGEAPAPEAVSFLWGPENDSGQPTAWVRPDTEPDTTWYWPTGGGAVFPGPAGDERLALFLALMAKKPGDASVWGFQVQGSDVAIVENAADPASAWQPDVYALPRVIEQGDGESVPVEWGVAALFIPGRDGAFGYVFIYATEMESGKQRDLILARTKPENFEDFSAWEFYGDGGYRPTPARAEAVVKNVASELSVDRIEEGGGSYVMVMSEPMLGDGILARTASAPEGPWSAPVTAYETPGVSGSKTLFSYAAKGHAPLSPPGTLLVSYVVNTNDFSELATNASIYRPRFILVPLSLIGIE